MIASLTLEPTWIRRVLRSTRTFPADSCSGRSASRHSNRKPKVYPRSAGMIGVRAPVAQRIERRPPEPDRLSVVATLVGPRAKCAGFYALREALGVSIACRSSGYLPGGTRSSQCCVLTWRTVGHHVYRPEFGGDSTKPKLLRPRPARSNARTGAVGFLGSSPSSGVTARRPHA